MASDGAEFDPCQADVHLHRARADLEPPGNLLVRQALGDEYEHLVLADAQSYTVSHSHVLLT